MESQNEIKVKMTEPVFWSENDTYIFLSVMWKYIRINKNTNAHSTDQKYLTIDLMPDQCLPFKNSEDEPIKTLDISLKVIQKALKTGEIENEDDTPLRELAQHLQMNIYPNDVKELANILLQIYNELYAPEEN